jgi:hypothetical protein
MKEKGRVRKGGWVERREVQNMRENVSRNVDGM